MSGAGDQKEKRENGGRQCDSEREPASPVDLIVACAAGASGDRCDESTWPDKHHGLVCGDCKARGGAGVRRGRSTARRAFVLLCQPPAPRAAPSRNWPAVGVCLFAGPGQPLFFILQDVQWSVVPPLPNQCWRRSPDWASLALRGS